MLVLLYFYYNPFDFHLLEFLKDALGEKKFCKEGINSQVDKILISLIVHQNTLKQSNKHVYNITDVFMP